MNNNGIKQQNSYKAAKTTAGKQLSTLGHQKILT